MIKRLLKATEMVDEKPAYLVIVVMMVSKVFEREKDFIGTAKLSDLKL